MDTLTEEAKEEEGGMPPAEDEEPDIFELEGMSELDLATGEHHQLLNGHQGQRGKEREAAADRGGWEGGGRIRPATPPNKVRMLVLMPAADVAPIPNPLPGCQIFCSWRWGI